MKTRGLVFLVFAWVIPALALAGDGYSWKVQEGDSYYMVARRLSINYQELVKLNQSRPLVAGAVIRLPGVRELSALSGDTWASVASVLRVREAELRGVNPHLGSELHAGDRVRLPGTAQINLGPEPQFIWPATGSIRAPYGTVDNIQNYGVVFTVSKKPVVAAEGGVVAFSGALRGLGHTVMLSHPGGYVTLYAGLEAGTPPVGQKLARGKPVGNALTSFFFSIFTAGSPMDPSRLVAGGARK